MATEPVMLWDGRLQVPVSAYDLPSGAIGDGVEVITQDDPRYAEWLPFVKRKEKP